VINPPAKLHRVKILESAAFVSNLNSVGFEGVEYVPADVGVCGETRDGLGVRGVLPGAPSGLGAAGEVSVGRGVWFILTSPPPRICGETSFGSSFIGVTGEGAAPSTVGFLGPKMVFGGDEPSGGEVLDDTPDLASFMARIPPCFCPGPASRHSTCFSSTYP